MYLSLKGDFHVLQQINKCVKLLCIFATSVQFIEIMITLGLYKFKIPVGILLSLWEWGVYMATNKIQTGIRFEPDLLYKIAYVAKANKRSLNAQLEYLAQQCVEDHEKINGSIPVDDHKLYKK